MDMTIARLYHPALWKMIYSYRVILVVLRVCELEVISLRYLFFRAPLLIAWTRLPILRDRRSPYRELGQVLAPVHERASLAVGAGQMGSDFALAQGTSDMANLQEAIVGGARPPSKFWSVFGCVMRGFFVELGPAFIKFGQILSMREEIPPTVKKELQLLQDRLAPMSYARVRKILERELDRPVEGVFEWVEETPIAAASLSQVHRAKLRKEREEVALKIQRPHLQGIVALDTVIVCDIFFTLVNLLLPTVRKSTNTSIFTESYRGTLAKEVDFALEERNQTAFRKLVEGHPIYSQCTKIAKTYREYSTTKLLTMELVKNYHRLDRLLDELTPQQLLEFATTNLDGLPPGLPLQLIWSQFSLQLEAVSHWGLSHGDVHLGNLYALEPIGDGGKWNIFLCDFGMMNDQNEADRIFAVHAGCSLSYYWDGRVMGRLFPSFEGNEGKEKAIAKFSDHLYSIIGKYFVEPKDGAEMVWFPITQRGTATNIVSEIMYSAATMGLTVPHTCWLLFKNMNYIANMGISMWTSINLTTVWGPHCKKYIKDVVLTDLETLNVTNMKASLPDILVNMRPSDRAQLLRYLSNGESIKPMETCWAQDWDERGLLATVKE